eukprot:gb/GFBE01067652.1/.p1 GENE.gb/GFBE01067652.1/~~gb/GFBE01067652.1/.p1  ORF type:complete len:356 (+),score=69.55 gb/GFBE01067652.1/:1-1068(+)
MASGKGGMISAPPGLDRPMEGEPAPPPGLGTPCGCGGRGAPGLPPPGGCGDMQGMRPMAGYGPGAQMPHPGGRGGAAAAAAAALQKFAAQAGSMPMGGMLSEENVRRHASAEEAAKQTAFRLKNSPLVASLAKKQAKQKEEAEAANAGSGTKEHRFTGRIKAFSTVQGFGFIQSTEVLKLFGCDAFLNQAVEGGIVVGGPVSFTIEMSKDGKPQARNVRIEESIPAESAPVAASSSGYGRSGYGNSMPNPMSSAKDLEGKVFRARVKSFNSDRGFGFLVCPELQHSFGGRDIYVANSQVPGRLLVGQECNFKLFVDKHGQPQAREMQMIERKETTGLGNVNPDPIASASWKLFSN